LLLEKGVGTAGSVAEGRLFWAVVLTAVIW